MSGYKQTEGKLDMSLLPLRALIEVAQVFHYGSLKYSRSNWLKGLRLYELRQAQKRHEGKFDLGQQIDTESGLFHLAHKACLALMELELYLQNNLLGDDGSLLYLNRALSAYSEDELFSCRFKHPKRVLSTDNTK